MILVGSESERRFDSDWGVEVAEGLLQSKVAVVSGAGEGLGRAICVALALNGAKVVAGDIDSDRIGRGVKHAGDLARYALRNVLHSRPKDRGLVWMGQRSSRISKRQALLRLALGSCALP